MDALVDCSYRRVHGEFMGVHGCLDSSGFLGVWIPPTSSWVSGFPDEFMGVWIPLDSGFPTSSWEFMGVWVPDSRRVHRCLDSLRTQRETQWYQRVTVRSTNLARAMAMGNLLGVIRTLYVMPVDSSRSWYLLVAKNHHPVRMSPNRHGRPVTKCVSFPSCLFLSEVRVFSFVKKRLIVDFNGIFGGKSGIAVPNPISSRDESKVAASL